MSVFTPLKQDEILSMCAAFGLAQPIASQPILQGTQNTNYWVFSQEAPYVLTVVEALSAQNIKDLTQFITYLCNAGIPCGVPLSNQQGLPSVDFQGKPVVVLKKLIGEPIDPPSAHYAEKMGTLLGTLHQLAENYTGPCLPNTRDAIWRQHAYTKVAPFLNTHERAVITEALALDEKIDWEQLPSGMIHADLFTDNILWDKDELSGVIDFYFACEGAFIYDLAVTLNDWCFTQSGEFKDENAQVLLNAYCAKRTLSMNERLMWRAVCSVAASRFWLSRRLAIQFPSLDRDVMLKDPAPFLEIMSFHEKKGVVLPQVM